MTFAAKTQKNWKYPECQLLKSVRFYTSLPKILVFYNNTRCDSMLHVFFRKEVEDDANPDVMLAELSELLKKLLATMCKSDA